MDIYDETFINFWRISNQIGLKFIMIGGVATNFHGYYRTTSDIDIWIEDTSTNRENLYQVFKSVGLGDFKSLLTIQFIPGWTDFYLDNGVRLDIMTTVKGLDEYTFDQAYDLASIAEIENVKVPFLHINQLIMAKKAANRPKDQIDVMALEKIKKLREEEN
ncbi:MAG: nucleotidyltransferase [Oligoflexus sp.]|nr:nucleotidyltransferase [Pseudopedobacter sp.]